MKTLSNKINNGAECFNDDDFDVIPVKNVKQFIKDIENAPKKESRIIQTDIGEYEKFVSMHFIKEKAGPKLI